MTDAASSVWTDKLVAILKTHHERGKTFREIAEIILAETGVSLSRNAVIGKARRLGLEGRGVNGNYNGNGRSKPAQKPRRTADGSLIQKLRREPPPVKPEPFVAAPPADIVSLRIPLIELGPIGFQCRWPDETRNGDGSHTFCGNLTVDGASYCPAHAALAWGPGTKSERNAANVARAA